MSIFTPKGACVFSEVKGVLLKDGQPLAGIKVTRWGNWKDEFEEEVITDENGSFYFPDVYQKSIRSLLPLEFSASQTLKATIGDEEDIFWGYAKREPEKNAELDGKPITLVCDLSNEMESLSGASGTPVTKCRWN